MASHLDHTPLGPANDSSAVAPHDQTWYSNLEVNSSQAIYPDANAESPPVRPPTGMEVVPGDAPEVLHPSGVSDPASHTRARQGHPLADTTMEVVPSDAPEVAHPHGVLSAMSHIYTGQESDLPDTAKEGLSIEDNGVPTWRNRRVLGLPLRTLVVVTVVTFLVIVGAIAGGVVGSRLHKDDGRKTDQSNGGNDRGNNSTTTAFSQTVLAASRVAASNYTDADGYRHRSVVFQDSTASLLVRLWDSQNETWSTVNLTDRLPGARVRAGTALACSAADYLIHELHIYCQLQDDSVHAYSWHSNAATDAEAWGEGVVAASSEHSVRPGTELTSAWCRAPASVVDVGRWVSAYQTATGGVTVANFSGSFASVINASSIDQPTGLMLRPRRAADNSLSSLNLVAESGGRLVQYEYSNGTWSDDPNLQVILPGTSDSSPSLPLASTQLKAWSQSLYMGLLRNGSLVRVQIEDNSFVVQNTDMVNGPTGTNFTAIAMTDDNMLYGIYDNAVHEYALNTTDAKTLVYVGKVFP